MTDPPRKQRLESAFKTVLQVLAILLLAGIRLTILHKGYADVAALARSNDGDAFFPALLRYLLRNLAGG